MLKKEGGILLVKHENQLKKLIKIVGKTKESHIVSLILNSMSQTNETRYVLKNKLKLGGFVASLLSRSKTYNKHFVP